MKARISLNERGESILSIDNTLGEKKKKTIAKEAREMNKKPFGCMVANLCVNLTSSNKKNQKKILIRFPLLSHSPSLFSFGKQKGSRYLTSLSIFSQHHSCVALVSYKEQLRRAVRSAST